MQHRKHFGFCVKVIFFVAAWILLMGLPAALAEQCPDGIIVDVKGNVHIEKPSGGSASIVKAGHVIYPGDVVCTGEDGSAAILASDESLIRMNRNTAFNFKNVAHSASWLNQHERSDRGDTTPSDYCLLRGEIWLRNKNGHGVIAIETAYLEATIKGRALNLLSIPDDSVIMTVQEGLVVASNGQGRLTIGENERIIAKPGAVLEKQFMVNARDAVQWTITVPYLPGAMVFSLFQLQPGNSFPSQGSAPINA